MLKYFNKTEIEIEKVNLINLDEVQINKTFATIKPPHPCQELYKTLESNTIPKTKKLKLKNFKVLPPIYAKQNNLRHTPHLLYAFNHGHKPYYYNDIYMRRLKRGSKNTTENVLKSNLNLTLQNDTNTKNSSDDIQKRLKRDIPHDLNNTDIININLTKIINNNSSQNYNSSTELPMDQISDAVTIHQVSGTPPTKFPKNQAPNYQPFQIVSSDFKDDYNEPLEYEIENLEEDKNEDIKQNDDIPEFINRNIQKYSLFNKENNDKFIGSDRTNKKILNSPDFTTLTDYREEIQENGPENIENSDTVEHRQIEERADENEKLENYRKLTNDNNEKYSQETQHLQPKVKDRFKIFGDYGNIGKPNEKVQNNIKTEYIRPKYIKKDKFRIFGDYDSLNQNKYDKNQKDQLNFHFTPNKTPQQKDEIIFNDKVEGNARENTEEREEKEDIDDNEEENEKLTDENEEQNENYNEQDDEENEEINNENEEEDDEESEQQNQENEHQDEENDYQDQENEQQNEELEEDEEAEDSPRSKYQNNPKNFHIFIPEENEKLFNPVVGVDVEYINKNKNKTDGTAETEDEDYEDDKYEEEEEADNSNLKEADKFIEVDDINENTELISEQQQKSDLKNDYTQKNINSNYEVPNIKAIIEKNLNSHHPSNRKKITSNSFENSETQNRDSKPVFKNIKTKIQEMPYIDVTTQKNYLNHPEVRKFIKNNKEKNKQEIQEDTEEENQETENKEINQEDYHKIFEDLHKYDPIVLSKDDSEEEITDDDDEYEKFRKTSKNDYLTIKNDDFINADTPYEIHLGKDFYENLYNENDDDEKEESHKQEVRLKKGNKRNTEEDNLQVETDKNYKTTQNKIYLNKKNKFKNLQKLKEDKINKNEKNIKQDDHASLLKNLEVINNKNYEQISQDTQISDHSEKPEITTEKLNTEQTLEKILEKKDAISRNQDLKEEPKSYSNYWSLEYVIPH